MNSMTKEKEDIQQVSDRISQLEKEIDATTDIVVKSQKEDEVKQLKKKRDDWKINKPLYDYFFNSGQILYNYYDLQDKIQQGDTINSIEII